MLIWMAFMAGILIYHGLIYKNFVKIDTLTDQPGQVSVLGVLDGIEKKDKVVIFTLTDSKIQFSDGSIYSKKILVTNFLSNGIHLEEYKIGNQLMIKGEISPFEKAGNPGQFDEYHYYTGNGYFAKLTASEVKIVNNSYSFIKQKLYEYRNIVFQSYQKCLDQEDAGLVSAMLLGEKSLLDPDIKLLYQQSGIAHIIAISGLNISLVGSAIFLFLQKCKCNVQAASLITMFFIFAYGELTGFSISTNRAVVMMIIFLFAKIVKRTYDMQSALALSGIIILAQQPYALFDCGFLLSFGAMLGIDLLNPCILKLIPERKERKSRVIKDFSMSLSASIVTLPIILYFYYEFPVYSVFLNLLVLVFISFLVILAMIGGIVACFNVFMGSFLLGGVHYVLQLYEWLCMVFQKLPYHTIVIGRPDMRQIICYYFILILFIVIIQKADKKIGAAILAGLCVIFYRPSDNLLKIHAMDVGQGDCLVIENPSGGTYLVDGGSSSESMVGRYRIAPFLKYNGITNIEYAFLTHADADHTNGILELVENMEQLHIRIKNVVLSKINNPDENYQSIVSVCEKSSIPIQYLNTNDQITDGNLSLTCFSPDQDFTWENANEYSLLMSLKYNQFDMLFAGDFEGKREKEILDRLKAYEVLKVAHHGSKNSTTEELLNVVKPVASIISCGLNNRYGHPHADLLERLKNCQSVIYNTSTQGKIMIETDGENFALSNFLLEK